MAYSPNHSIFRRTVFLPSLFILCVVLCPFFLGGCATGGIRDSSMVLEIQPLPMKRGKPALARVNAPMDAIEVIGSVRVVGSPELIFAKDKEKSLWYFYGTIPFSPWVKPGRYTIRATAKMPEGKKRYTELKVELK